MSRPFAAESRGILLAGALVLLSACAQDLKVPANRYALLIGIQDYPGAGNDLNYPDDDVNALAPLLASEGWTTVTTLLNGNATSANIEAAIRNLSVDDDATILVYYSGHGSTSSTGETAYLIPYDGLVYSPATGTSVDRSKWITPAIMTQWMAGAHAEHRMLILDSCFSGGFALGDGSVDTSPANYGVYEGGTTESPTIFAALSKFSTLVSANLSSYGAQEVLTLSAAGSGEPSWDAGDYQHGTFTYYLLRAGTEGSDGQLPADSDGDGLVSVNEAYVFAKKAIKLNWDSRYAGLTEDQAYAYINNPDIGYVPDFLPHISGGSGDLALFVKQ
jgi:hypothetical protein